jgi:hypothetical protein
MLLTQKDTENTDKHRRRLKRVLNGTEDEVEDDEDEDESGAPPRILSVPSVTSVYICVECSSARSVAGK